MSSGHAADGSDAALIAPQAVPNSATADAGLHFRVIEAETFCNEGKRNQAVAFATISLPGRAGAQDCGIGLQFGMSGLGNFPFRGICPSQSLSVLGLTYISAAAFSKGLPASTASIACRRDRKRTRRRRFSATAISALAAKMLVRRQRLLTRRRSRSPQFLARTIDAAARFGFADHPRYPVR
jgi:hypothetical protein